MKDMHKKLLSIAAAATLTVSAFSFAACGDDYYTGDALTGYQSTDSKAESNGGFAVKKDGFVYFINGAEENTADNEYGDVVKGSLMRIADSDLQAGDYSKAETVVPMLFVAQNFDAGIYIYGDYVYYATPTTDKNLSGDVENTWIDFKRAKLDGSETMKSYYFRLEDNTSAYRFVEDENGVVYCLYEEDSALKSFNTSTKKTTTLVSGAKSSFFYDVKDPTSPYVYYTMSVTVDVDTSHASTSDYDQLYRVSAAATATVNADEASYTVSNGKTYDFDKSYLEKLNKEAKENDTDEPYDFDDYTTYPYVNLGDLVLDGVGTNSTKTVYNYDTTTAPIPLDGYNYTISSYQNGGVYFTRTDLPQTSSSGENTNLYFLADADTKENWNAISGNATGKDSKIVTVASDTKNATSSAVFSVDKDGAHNYFYVTSDGDLYRQWSANKIKIASGLSNATLWKLDKELNELASGESAYLYYYASASVGNSLVRINCTGADSDYKKAELLPTEEKEKDEYTPKSLDFLTFNDSWYKPEFFGDVILYSNAQSFGDVSYNYVYATKMGTAAEIVAANEAYASVTDYISEAKTDVQTAMTYYFRTGKTAAYDDVIDLYSDSEQAAFTEFVKKFEGDAPEFKLESSYLQLVGTLNETDAEAIDEAWVDSLLSETTEEDEDDGLPTWAIVLIVVGSVLVVAAATLIPVLVIHSKKKAKAKADEATVNAYKRKKIDTTDDKTIDVYADDEEPAETVESEDENKDE